MIGLDDLGGLDQLDAKALSLQLQPVGKLTPVDAVGKAREVIEALGDAGLSAKRRTFKHQHIHALARGVQRGGQPGRPSAHHDQIVVAEFGLGGQPELDRQLGIVWLNQEAAVGEDDGWHALVSVVQFLDDGRPGLILLDIDIVVVDALLAEEFLGALAVAAPHRAVELDVVGVLVCDRWGGRVCHGGLLSRDRMKV